MKLHNLCIRERLLKSDASCLDDAPDDAPDTGLAADELDPNFVQFFPSNRGALPPQRGQTDGSSSNIVRQQILMAIAQLGFDRPTHNKRRRLNERLEDSD
jgi:hypothetical protein